MVSDPSTGHFVIKSFQKEYFIVSFRFVPIWDRHVFLLTERSYVQDRDFVTFVRDGYVSRRAATGVLVKSFHGFRGEYSQGDVLATVE
jgi:hypothetical protein